MKFDLISFANFATLFCIQMQLIQGVGPNNYYVTNICNDLGSACGDIHRGNWILVTSLERSEDSEVPIYAYCSKRRLVEGFKTIDSMFTWFVVDPDVGLKYHGLTFFEHAFHHRNLGFPNKHPDGLARLKMIEADLMRLLDENWFGRSLEIVSIPVMLGKFLSRKHGMIVVGWSTGDKDRKHGYMYITTAGSADYYNNGDLGEKIKETVSNLETFDGTIGHKPTDIVYEVDETKILFYYGIAFRYKIVWATLMKLLECKRNHGFSICNLMA